ncbi:MAG: Tryptophan synthase alpha chain [Gammaproteobacteria bacterium]|nr:MAG: Tryptophan synthase alpha chain [Gammaproteobacteria bacterium]
MNRVTKFFNSIKDRKKNAFISYVVCGDPNQKSTCKILHTMVDSGVDIIELGIPFTDPIADGPVIQKGVERALKSKTSLLDVLSIVKQFRKTNNETPIVLMGYSNPIEKMGYSRFASLAKSKGVDGILIVDAPPEESLNTNKIFKKYGLCHIFLASPTTELKRLQNIIKLSSGYLYYVSVKGITGSSITSFESIKKNVEQIRQLSGNKIPIAVGFGIKNGRVAKTISMFSDAIIIGSSIVELIEKYQKNKEFMHKKIRLFIKSIARYLENK